MPEYEDIMSTAKKEWTRDRSKRSRFTQINDIVHDRIYVYHPLDRIIDTPEFQRLRYVKQLGLVHLTYPSADHSRFTHSLGVYALADSFVRELAEVQPELGISSQDQLCVCIAALVHDLGHGPFSHLYETFVHSVDRQSTFRHEELSKRLFRRMLNTNVGLRMALDEFLDDVDYVFIEELIDPPTPFVQRGIWQLRGRPMEKSFLYDFVSNKHSGMDVDKFDYFLRDSHLTGVPIPFSTITVGRIRDSTRAIYDKQLGFRRLAVAEKNINEIRDVFESRMMLFERVYHHKTGVAMDLMIMDVLTAADDHLRFNGDDRRDYRLSDAYLNERAYLLADDRVLYLIKTSDDPNLAVCRRLLRDLERRRLPRFVDSILIDDFENRTIDERQIHDALVDDCPEANRADVLVKISCSHRGLGMSRRPIDSVCVYDERHPMLDFSSSASDGGGGAARPKTVSSAWYKYNVMPMGGKAVAHVYVAYGAAEASSMRRLRAAAIRLESRMCLNGNNNDGEHGDLHDTKCAKMEKMDEEGGAADSV